MQWKHPIHFLAYGFGSGLMPVMPGTFGTLVGIGFLLGDKVQGKFKLEILKIGATTKKAYSDSSKIKTTEDSNNS